MDLRDFEALDGEDELWKAVGRELYSFALALQVLPVELQESFLALLTPKQRELVEGAQQKSGDATAEEFADALTSLAAHAARVRSGALLH